MNTAELALSTDEVTFRKGALLQDLVNFQTYVSYLLIDTMTACKIAQFSCKSWYSFSRF